MGGIKWKPVVVGFLVDILGTTLLAVLLAVNAVAVGVDLDPIARFDTGGLIVLEVLGLALTAVGGFVAARMAQTAFVRHGVAVGGCALLLTLLGEPLGLNEGMPRWYQVVSFLGVVPAGALGGYLAAKGMPPTTQ